MCGWGQQRPQETVGALCSSMAQSGPGPSRSTGGLWLEGTSLYGHSGTGWLWGVKHKAL